MKRLIMDLDNTISKKIDDDYMSARPDKEVVKKLYEYKDMGYDIVIHSSRNMRTYDANLGLINVNTLPKVIKWLDKNNIPYDEIYMGKPWCGFDGFYVDDRSIRPSEFKKLSISQIKKLLEKE